MLETIGAIGGALGGVGQFLGGLGGLFGGGGSGSKKAKELFAYQVREQERMMKNQLQWRVEDARAAGVHPLAAIGANISSPSVPPIVAGGDSGSGRNIGSALSDMGQGVDRALGAVMNDDERYTASLRALQLERGEMENAVLRFKLNQLQSSPPFPSLDVGEEYMPVGVVSDPARYSSGRVDVVPLSNEPALQATGRVSVQPAEVITTVPGMPGNQAGRNPDVQWYQDNEGNWFNNPSEKFKADDLGSAGAIQWFNRNRLLPGLPYAAQNPGNSGVIPRPPAPPPKGAVGWFLNPLTGRYTPAYGDKAWLHPWFIPDADRR